MNALHFAIASQWITAGVAFVLHSKGHPRTAYGLMVTVMAVLSWLACTDHVSHSRPAAQAVSPVARQASVEPLAPAVEARFFASAIGKAYHRPECFYVTKQLQHAVGFKTREEAEASGRHPCTNCLGSQIARADK